MSIAPKTMPPAEVRQPGLCNDHFVLPPTAAGVSGARKLAAYRWPGNKESSARNHPAIALADLDQKPQTDALRGGGVALHLHDQTFEAERLLMAVTRGIDVSGERHIGSL